VLKMATLTVVGMVALAPSGAIARAAATSPWSIQPTANPVGGTDSVLSGVSCSSRTACTAVGYYTNRSLAGVTLAERWNGQRWSIERTPRVAGARAGLLFAVSCVSSRACVAVGSVTDRAGVTVPLAQRWNGTGWSIQKTPSLMGENHPNLSYLGGVSCASPRYCIAVGYSGNRNGSSGTTLAELWNGAWWSVERTPRPPRATVGFLSAVSCVAPRSCTAVGFFNRADAGIALAERWNGSRWSLERASTPEGAASAQLVGVSCTAQRLCVATGYFTIVTGIEVMLAEQSNPMRWSIERTLYPAGAAAVQFGGVSCGSSSSCIAVGFFVNGAGLDQTLAERSTGAMWVIQPTPNPAGVTSSSLAAVSCTSPTACTAVGSFINAGGAEKTLAERYSAPTTARRNP
jgi:hypothetical protein